jgi:hypothetical protein
MRRPKILVSNTPVGTFALAILSLASVLEVLMIRLWPFLLEREISCLRRDSRAALRNVCVNVL